MFDLQRIEAETFVRRVEYYAVIDSTNSRALKLAADPRAETPLLVVAERQTTGRGRGDNLWWSATGSLTFSLLISDHIASLPRHVTPQLSLTAGLAVCEALRATLPEANIGVKWPNDVYVARRQKVSGILIEIPRSTRRSAVIGIGINANNSFQDAPHELRDRAVALADIAGKRLDMSTILIATLRRLEAGLTLLATDPAQLRQRWQQHCILTGHQLHVVSGVREWSGICVGIDDHGALLLNSESGPVTIASGTVKDFA